MEFRQLSDWYKTEAGKAHRRKYAKAWYWANRERARTAQAKWKAKQRELLTGSSHVLCRRCKTTPRPEGHSTKGAFVCDSCKRHCERCSRTITATPGRHYARKFCSTECYDTQRAESRADRLLAQQIGRSCDIGFSTCPECEVLFTKQHERQVYCSPLHASRRNSRQYQRRTKTTAIRYWRIADTPEAKDLARTMFALRQLLRNGNDQQDPQE